jgi:hypothetical protein
METVGVADLEKYWITFEQLLQRWQIKEDLLASYCVCVDTSKGNPLLVPHFYQGEFSTPGGETWKRLAKYEPEYKNAADYLNKSKTEAQLVQEFLESVSGIEKDTIWFLLSDVEELEAADYSLCLVVETSTTNNMTADIDYITLDAPITFEEILCSWIGQDDAKKLLSIQGRLIEDEEIDIIRQVEWQIESAIRNGDVKTYRERLVAGRRLFFQCDVDMKLPKASSRDAMSANLVFAFHAPRDSGIPSDPVYFDSVEVFNKFPFLKESQQDVSSLTNSEQDAVQASPLEGEKKISLNIPPSLWAGKSPDAAFAALKERGLADEVIAVILSEKLEMKKTQAGKLFHQEERAKGVERDAKTYQNTINTLLTNAERRYQIIHTG